MDPARLFESTIRFIWNKFIMQGLVSRIFYSFPVQLLILNLRKNLVILSMWGILWLIITERAGTTIGLPYLFLEPEYMDQVNFWSTFIVGLTLGGFTMSFHITCYILDGQRFSFLGGLGKPFRKFCINNSLVPLAFLATYLISFFQFQYSNALELQAAIFIKIGGLLSGVILIIFFFGIYFLLTNEDVFRLMSGKLNERLRRTVVSRVNIMARYKTAKQRLRVDYYLADNLLPKRVNNRNTIDRATILKVFDQNHLNSVIIQSTIFALILFLGSYSDNPYFQIPAGASVILLLTIVTMFIGALNFWLRGWAFTALLVLILLVNSLIKWEFFELNYQAYGLKYDTRKAAYTLRKIKELSDDENFIDDVRTTTLALDNWRAKFPKDKKPKIVFVCSSGGGHRACIWTMRTLQHVDSTLGGQLMEHTMLMTGASGGMIGAAYFRELYLQKLLGENIDIYAPAYLNNIARDHLNSIAFSWFISDIFFQTKRFTYRGDNYNKDRGYAFEEQLNKNTLGIIDKPL